jgi:hypothetical protein
VADELIEALSNEKEWPEKSKCPREAQFHELYAVMGNKKAQDEIRERAEKRSCYILRQYPDACDCMPDGFGAAVPGEACPNNPYTKNAELIDALAQSRSLLEISRYYADLIELNQVDTFEMMPEEYAVIRIMLRERKKEQFEMMQASAASSMIRPGG